MSAAWCPPWLARGNAEWRPRTVAPLVLRAWLAEPVVWDTHDGLPLDGPLAWAAMLLASGMPPGEACVESPRAVGIEIALPLAERTFAGRPVWCVSWASPAPVALGGQRWRRKRADVESYGLRGRVMTTGGAYKALEIPSPTLVTPWLEWSALGDADRLRALLSHLYAVGRDNTRGPGAVEGWEVRPGADDGCLRDGHVLRALPIARARDADLCHGDPRVTAYRPPYWRKDARTLCAVPRCT